MVILFEDDHHDPDPSDLSLKTLFLMSSVAHHYNSRPQIGVNKRKDSPIFQLKAFNNWIKSMLIGNYTNQNARALEIGCGKGGDLIKWHYLFHDRSKARIESLLGLDIAEISIQHAQDRYRDGHGLRYKAEFKALDCFTPELENVLANRTFNVISCQFAFHYCFESQVKVENTLKTISNHLQDGGYFFGTVTIG